MNEKSINNYTYKLEDNEVKALESNLKEKGWEFQSQQHANWKAATDGVTIVAYLSGKVTVQGKKSKDFILYTLEPEIIKRAELGYETKKDLSNDLSAIFTPHIGIDESGKGDFFGPLVIASVFVDNTSLTKLSMCGVKDSKLIKDDKKIIAIASEIRGIVGGVFSVVVIGPDAYNRLYCKINNLNKLLAWGHSRALENILEKNIDCTTAISDKFGKESFIENSLLKHGKKINLIQKVRAESDIAVAAASILARAEFVSKLEKLSVDCGYNLLKGAGANVLKLAAEIIKKEGLDKLSTVAKMHFKTSEQARKMAE